MGFFKQEKGFYRIENRNFNLALLELSHISNKLPLLWIRERGGEDAGIPPVVFALGRHLSGFQDSSFLFSQVFHPELLSLLKTGWDLYDEAVPILRRKASIIFIPSLLGNKEYLNYLEGNEFKPSQSCESCFGRAVEKFYGVDTVFANVATLQAAFDGQQLLNVGLSLHECADLPFDPAVLRKLGDEYGQPFNISI